MKTKLKQLVLDQCEHLEIITEEYWDAGYMAYVAGPHRTIVCQNINRNNSVLHQDIIESVIVDIKFIGKINVHQFQIDDNVVGLVSDGILVYILYFNPIIKM